MKTDAGLSILQIVVIFVLLELLQTVWAAGPSEGQLRLVQTQGPLVSKGRVEIYHDSQWGTICNDFW